MSNACFSDKSCTTGLPLISSIFQRQLKCTPFFFSLIWVYASSFSLGSNMTGGFTLKGKSSEGYNILFTSSMKRTFCDANKFRLRIADRTIGRFEFCFSFWVFIRSFLKGGGSSLKKKIPQNNLQDERRIPSMNFRENTCKN